MNEPSGWLRFAKVAGVFVGGVAGVAGATAAISVAAEKYAIGRIRKGPDRDVDEPFGQLPADRSYNVIADDGVPLHVEEVGPKNAQLVLVFAHGWTLEMGSWHFQRQGLADLTNPTVRMVFYDQRSHGRSGRSDAEHSTIDQLGSDLAEVIKSSAGDRPVVLIGHSMGGMTIMALADVAPKLFDNQVLGAALLSTSAGSLLTSLKLGLPRSLAPRALPLLVRAAKASPNAIDSARKPLGDAMWLLVRRFSFGAEGAGPSLSDYVDKMIGDTPVEVVADFLPTLAGHDKVAALPGLHRTEVFISCGTDDRLTPPEHSAALYQAIPDADFFSVEGAGHMAMMERPELMNLRLRAFVHRAAKRADRRGRRLA